MSIYEAVPNVSEGRRLDVVDGLAAAATSGGARLLHRTSDPDHHRSVLTLAGSLAEIEGSLFALYAEAISVLDLRTHSGVHPRIGALDVAPVIPLEGGDRSQAIHMVRRLGRRLAERFDLPILLYEHAASTAERRNLAHHRRGGWGKLSERLAGEWPPDFGPPTPHPTAGATALGVRDLLIAFNIVLATDELRIAKRIARRIRERSGGLPGVKALGFPLTDGRVQVSMNLVDFRRTSLFEIFDRVESLAASRGVRVDESELIGLIPRAALAGGRPEDLALRDFSRDRVLETRLEQVGLIDRPPEG